MVELFNLCRNNFYLNLLNDMQNKTNISSTWVANRVFIRENNVTF